MPCKSILTVLTPHRALEADLSALEVAISLARRHDAHLDVLAIGLDETCYGFFIPETGLALQSDGAERAIEAARLLDAHLRRRLSSEDIRWNCETAAIQTNSLGELVASRARFSDLVALPRPYGRDRTVADAAAIEAALFTADVPVLVLPPGLSESPDAQRVVIAWNRSPEALAAIRAALPMLRRASFVEIAIIDPPDHGPEAQTPGEPLAQWLARHGVKASIAVLARTRPRISEVLTQHLRDCNADLLVMGAYGHSRFREAILGGATRDLLETTEIPIFMAR